MQVYINNDPTIKEWEVQHKVNEIVEQMRAENKTLKIAYQKLNERREMDMEFKEQRIGKEHKKENAHVNIW